MNLTIAPPWAIVLTVLVLGVSATLLFLHFTRDFLRQLPCDPPPPEVRPPVLNRGASQRIELRALKQQALHEQEEREHRNAEARRAH